MLNIGTIYAIHKTSAMAKTLKILLLSLAFSDVAVGLFSKAIYTFFLVKWLQLENVNCNTYQVLNISGYLFSPAINHRVSSMLITDPLCASNMDCARFVYHKGNREKEHCT